eukprot:CAMPEP_0170561690 /NCGR_PEP_ID=MMETSP0211-20121228/56298_1 /TAXON_ID=311385 /ORGANISM="Pseudokeronopsis sp., Strain OXSARD2" /LENGTH=115 /DNA_ID=CAMNT_0010877557 /DNA_START=444 /DNA_END=791 /DNA_ORIENTATION=+
MEIFSDVGSEYEEKRPTKFSITIIKNLQNIKFIRAGYGRSAYVTTDNRVFVWGYNFDNIYYDEPTILFGSKEEILDFKFGLNQGLVLFSNLDLYTFGEGTYGEMGRDSLASTMDS